MARNLGAAVLIFFALLVQQAVINRLGFSVTPDLALLVVIALAVLRGVTAGAVIGFCAGLAADLMPPADHMLGQYALVMCLIGVVAGWGATRMPLLTVAACAVAAPALAVGVGSLLGDPGVDWGTFEAIWPGTALCNLIAAPIVVWVVRAMFSSPGRRKALAVGWRRSL